jgi:competence protein ComEC
MSAALTWLERRASYAGIGSVAIGLVLADAGPGLPIAAVTGLVALAAVGRAPRLALLVALAVGAGYLVGGARLDAVDAPGQRIDPGRRIAGLAELTEAPRPGRLGSSAEVLMISGPARGARLLARLPMGLGVGAAEAPGVELSLAGTFRRLEPADSGSGFAAYLRAQGVAGELDVERATLTGARRGGWRGAVDRMRRRSERAVAMGLDPTAAALARGMVLGADESVPIGVRDDFRDAGLAHVLAASGQNIVLLCALAIPLLMAVGVPYRARVPALLASIALYVPLAGAGPSIQRAGVMAAASLAAVALARPPSRAYALGLAAVVTLLLNPRAYADPGWQLSFAAVAGIAVIAPSIARSLRSLWRPLANGIALTIAATLATAPLLAHHFGAVSTAGLLANVAALPLIAPIMWLGTLRAGVGQAVSVAGPLGDAAAVVNAALGWPLAPLLSWLEGMAALFADMPGGQVDLTLAAPTEVAVAYIAIAGVVVAARVAARRVDTRASTAVAYVRRLPRARQLGLAVGVAALTALVLARTLAPAGPPANLTVSFLDVGQGDATLIQHPDGSAVLFDGGPPEGAVVRLLRRAGVRRLSAVVMTHMSRDHHGGLAEVVEQVPVEVLLDGGDGTRDPSFRAIVARAVTKGTRVMKAVAPALMQVGALRIAVLSPRPRPAGPPPEDPNPRAIVAIVSCDGFDLLLSGDAESEALLPLHLPDVEAMKVPHHGSSDPGLPEVLDRLRPEIASIPVGVNDYGHPAPSTLSALRRADVQTWRNDRNGTVRLEVKGGAVHVDAERGGPVPGAP